MTKKQKNVLYRIVVSAVILAALLICEKSGTIKNINKSIVFGAYMIPYLIIGYDIIIKAFKGIKNKQPFDECLLMVIATIGAIVIGVIDNGDYVEAIAVMWFYQVGELFQSYAVGKSRRNISDLMDICPEYANVLDENDNVEEYDPEDVEIGSRILIKKGEKIPIDGIVIDGETSLDTAALTGESVPRTVRKNDEVISGCINLDSAITIKTTKLYEESTVAKVFELIEEASSRKSKSEKFITKFARYYTPIVVYSALALAIVPPIILNVIGQSSDFKIWIYRALTFLVISCPCALVISIPLSFFAGIGSASHEGVLVKGSNYLELLADTKTIVFDKTGTLTKGVFEVVAVHPKTLSTKELLHIAAHVERFSTHPIANSIRKAYSNEADSCIVSDATEIAGQGIEAMVNDHKVSVGNTKLMDSIGAKWNNCSKLKGTTIHVALDNVYQGHIVISDVIKENSKCAISELKKNGVKQTVMLTGDSKSVAENVANELKVDEVYSELLPQNKVEEIEKILANKENEKDVVAFVGDGINDAPVLSRADIGIAMGVLGSDAAIEAADVVLMDDDPLKIATAIRISKKCLTIVKENIYFAIGIKVICLILGAVGIANMWFAIFADVGVMVLAVLNAIRCLHIKNNKISTY
ncbi:heavy metal translocating P-type ATPase [Lachnobacterium bovis]|uniref:Cd(2+)-exporting ATPase n=1 Tax=Lachnobacterium bovis DSM 14045 TaxID=1122142 RepID=A0A1H3KNW8_9FIRM|nr:heavy metal translocating P-type ATPase [Lachnobacterium bovis]SDY53740.1 Cd2+/Zn2+-exporting ATPase [Lachnobacterium bovis DSM 14045]